MKILIDSDICLDLLTGRKPYHYSANKLFSEIDETDLTAFVSPDSFSNMFYILGRQYKAIKIIPKLKSLRSLVRVPTFTEEYLDLALDSAWNDFEDAMQFFCARGANCEAIITRNGDDFANSSLPVFTPMGFLNR